MATLAAPAAAALLALEQQRRQFPAAYAAAKSGPEVRWRELAAGLETYPLYPYLEAAALDRELPRADAADVREFLTRHEAVPVAESLRRRWLVQLASRKQWPAFLDAWRAQDDDALRCLHAQARIATGRTADLAPDALALWLQASSLAITGVAYGVHFIFIYQISSPTIIFTYQEFYSQPFRLFGPLFSWLM